MEEFGENSNGNSQIQNLTEFSEFSQNLQYSEAYIYKSVEFWTKLQIPKL